jgi:hypothetical protein
MKGSPSMFIACVDIAREKLAEAKILSFLGSEVHTGSVALEKNIQINTRVNVNIKRIYRDK